MENKEQAMIPIGGLWINQDRNGKDYWSGYLGDAKLLIFENSFKEAGSNQPDFKIYVAPKPQKNETTPATTAAPKAPF